MISDNDKLAMIHSLVDLEGNKGRIYEMTYTVDYYYCPLNHKKSSPTS